MKRIILIVGIILVITTVIFSQTRRTREQGYIRQSISSPEGQTINLIIKACDPDGGSVPTTNLDGITKPPLGSALNKAHPLAQGLAGAWIFNEGSGNIAYDLCGKRNATIGTAGVWVPNGIELDGSVNSKIQLSSKYLPAQTQVWSAVARFRYDAIGDCVISASTGTTYAFSIMTNERLYTRQGSDQEIVTKATGFFTPPQTHTFAITHNIKTGIWYQDGAQIWTVNTFTGLDQYVWQVDCLTGGTSGQNALDGVLEFVYLYDRILTSEEVMQINTTPYKMFFAPLESTALMSIVSDSLPPGSTLGPTFILPISEIPDLTDPANCIDPIICAECASPTSSWYGAFFTWTPTYTQNGSYPTYFHALDNSGGDDWVVYIFDISNKNRPPQL